MPVWSLNDDVILATGLEALIHEPHSSIKPVGPLLYTAMPIPTMSWQTGNRKIGLREPKTKDM